jgi:hypothetical protein
VRDAWEEVAAVVCALWPLCAVPVVIVDTVAMPGGRIWFLVGESSACRMRRVRTGRRCRGSRLSSQRLCLVSRGLKCSTALKGKEFNPLLYHHLGQSPFTAFSDVPGTLHLGIPIHNYICSLRTITCDHETQRDVASPLIYRSISQIMMKRAESIDIHGATQANLFRQSSHLSRLARH